MSANTLEYILNIIMYFAIIQAFFLSFHFYYNKQFKSPPNKLLGILILLFGISVLAAQLYMDKDLKVFYLSRWMVLFRFTLNLVLGVIFYFHIKTILQKDFKIKSNINLIYFIPVIISTIVMIGILTNLEWPVLSNSVFFINKSLFNIFYNLIYIILILFNIRKQFGSFQNFKSSETNSNVKWLSFITGTFIIFWLLEISLFIIMRSKFYLILLPYLAIVYTAVPFIFSNTILLLTIKSPKIFNYKRNSSFKINPQNNRIIDDLIKLLERDKIFTNMDISVSKVAQQLQVNPKYLSTEINENLNQSFTELINFYRITESKRLLKEDSDKSIQEIMSEVGYNSKSVFNTQFKKDTGVTPKEFRVRNTK